MKVEDFKIAVTKLVNDKLTNCEDDLYRCECAFEDLTDNELDVQHGSSGKSKRQIWQGYIAEHERLKKILDYLNRGMS